MFYKHDLSIQPYQKYSGLPDEHPGPRLRQQNALEVLEEKKFFA
jgi:hypothetical protein